MTGDLADWMWPELAALAPDGWSAIRRAVAACVAADLLADLNGPPPPASRCSSMTWGLAHAGIPARFGGQGTRCGLRASTGNPVLARSAARRTRSGGDGGAEVTRPMN